MTEQKTKLALAGALAAALLGLAVVNTAVAVNKAQQENTKEPTAAAVETAAVQEEEPLTLEMLPQAEFTDISTSDAGYDALRYTAYYGLLRGMEDGSFHPCGAVDRATIVTVLYRLSREIGPAGEIELAAKGSTSEAEPSAVWQDVPTDSWYAEAVSWASEAGIVQGVDDQHFAPLDRLTRSQLAAVLYRFAAWRGDDVSISGDLSAYNDADRVEAYAVLPLTWAVEGGIFKSVLDAALSPRMPVSRLQLAQALTALQAAAGDALAAQILAQTAPPAPPESKAAARHEELQAVVDSISQKYGAAGVQVAVIEKGQVTDTYAYGWATKGSNPMTPQHKLRVASISKVAVGMTAMCLREEGTIDLDTSIGDYWGFPVKNPAYPNTPVSIRSIMTHTSSIVNAGDDVSRSYSNVSAKLRSGYFSRVKPGDLANWNYNNFAFSVLGMTLELASGEYISDILDRRLFNAMDIDADFFPGEVRQTELLATIYRHDGSVGRTVSNQQGIKRGNFPGSTGSPFAGGLTISAEDLGKLVALLACDGCWQGVELMDRESVEMMETYAPQAVPGGSRQALPLRHWDDIFGRDGAYYHTGSAYGVFNCMSYDPLTGDGVVVLTTGASGAKDDYGIYRICAEISTPIYEAIR